MIRLRGKYGNEGYGAFWLLAEMMREQNGGRCLRSDADVIGIEMRYDRLPELVADCCAWGVFESDDEYFWSARMVRDIDALNDKREKARVAGVESGKQRRFNGRSTNESIVKYSKGKKSRYGTHVTLTDKQHQHFTDGLGSKTLDKYIAAVNDYCDSSGKVYKDYAAAIRTFLRRDKVEIRDLTRCPQCAKLLPDVGTFCVQCGWRKDE